ncbi:hypothetical protein CBR_g60277 [Chara braunii]|uniref:Uncharacterized protein n=1 Tax=Chara braunii TaxID=69332 RepID=A0A388MF49_CHABU|nr:hypothetical protein CBR_g60277 [Chara braunii]|eukprot:GBG93196.1 hypothetical protein CBR_g60277 [Chara braunii]
MARMINAKMEELDKQHQARTKEENKKIWKEIERVVGDPMCAHHGKDAVLEAGDNRKRSQEEMEGSPPILPTQGRPRVAVPMTQGTTHLSPLDAGLLLMELDNVQRSQDSQFGFIRRMMELVEKLSSQTPMCLSNPGGVEEEPLGFDRVILGKKVVVASAGNEGRAKYIEDLKKELLTKSKYQLESLWKADQIKYFNKKQASTDLVEIRARDAYGDESEEEGLDNIAADAQEENPS